MNPDTSAARGRAFNVEIRNADSLYITDTQVKARVDSKRQKTAMRACNYELFQFETLAPPPPATVDTKIRQATQAARPEVAARTDGAAARPTSELPGLDELYRLFDYYNWKYFGGRLPRVKIEYSTRMTCAGSYSPNRRLIKIGRRYHEIFPQDLEDTLKHEMIHIRHYHHDAKFKAEAVRIGASLKAREHPNLRRPPKYVYECPGCGAEYPRQRRLVQASCTYCSANRRYDPRFKLRRKRPRVPRSGT